MKHVWARTEDVARRAARTEIGIVGAGDIVQAHLPVLLNMAAVKVRWLTDRDESRAAAVARAYRLASVKMPADLADLPSCDLLLLAIPYGGRKPYLDEFMARGTGLYVEKPLARSLAEHHSLCDGYESHRLACGFQMRSSGKVTLVKTLVSNELLGPLERISYGHGGRGLVVGGKYQADIRSAGGGMLFDVACHGIDAALYASGAKDVAIESVVMEVEEGFDLHTEATMMATLGVGYAVPFHVVVSSLQETSGTVDFMFSNGIVSFAMAGQSVVMRPVSGSERYALGFQGSDLYPSSSAQVFAEFWRGVMDALHSGIPNWTSALASLTTTGVIEAIYDAGLGTRV